MCWSTRLNPLLFLAPRVFDEMELHEKSALFPRVAVQEYSRLENSERKEPEDLSRLETLYRCAKYAEVLALCDPLLDEKPSSAGLLNYRGLSLLRLKRLEESRACFLLLIKQSPNQVVAYNNLGLVYRELDENVKAKTCFETALRLSPGYVDALVNLGGNLADSSEPTAAREILMKAVGLDPSNPTGWTNLGCTACDLGLYTQALLEFGEALSIDENFIPALRNKASALKQLGRGGEANLVYEQLLEADPKSKTDHYGYGLSLLGQGRYREASESFAICRTLGPLDFDAMGMQGRCFVQMGRIGEGLELQAEGFGLARFSIARGFSVRRRGAS